LSLNKQKIAEYNFQKDLADYQLVLGALIGLAILLFFQNDSIWFIVALIAVIANDHYEKRFDVYEKTITKKKT